MLRRSPRMPRKSGASGVPLTFTNASCAVQPSVMLGRQVFLKVAQNPSEETISLYHGRSLPSLPAELWAQICYYAVIARYPAQLYLYEGLKPQTLWSLTRLPTLAYTCKVLRSECLRQVGDHTLFLLMESNLDLFHWRRWLDALTPDAKLEIQRNLYITSGHQDVVSHMERCDLMPRGAAFDFAEPEGVGYGMLGDFTYRITLVSGEAADDGSASEVDVGLRQDRALGESCKSEDEDAEMLPDGVLFPTLRYDPAYDCEPWYITE